MHGATVKKAHIDVSLLP